MSDANQRSSWLAWLGSFCFKRPLLTIALSLFLAALSVSAAVMKLTLETDWLVLFSPNHPEIQRLEFWRENLPGSKDMAVIVSGGDAKARQRAVEQLGKGMEASTEHLESPLYSLPTDLFLKSGLYYLPAAQLQKLSRDTAALVSATTQDTGPGPLDLETLTQTLMKDPDGRRLIIRFLQTLERTTRGELRPEGAAEGLLPKLTPEGTQVTELVNIMERPSERVYLSLDGGQTLLVLVAPRLEGASLEASGPAVAEVRGLVEKARREFPHLTFNLTGEPVLLVDERSTIARDSVRGTVCSLLLVLLLFRFGFREVTRPALALVTLIIGLLWTVGCTALTIGHLNFITVTYIPILVGIGIDFGIHIAFRFYECRQHMEPDRAIRETMNSAGKDTAIGALTTAVAFGVLIVVGFRGVAELGGIAFCGVLLCQLAACTLLPALLGLLEQRGYQLPGRGRQELNSWFEALKPWRGSMLALCALLALFGAAGAFYVKFDIHLLKMQSPKLESVRTELELVASGKSSVLTALVPASDIEEARRLEERLRRLDSVAQVISPTTFLPLVGPEEPEAAKKMVAHRADVARILKKLAEEPPIRARAAERLMTVLSQAELTSLEPTVLSLDREALKDIQLQLESRLQERGPGPIIDAVNLILKNIVHESQAMLPLLEAQTGEILQLDDLPPPLLRRLVGQDGQLVLKVFPKLDIWRSQNLHRFLDQVRSVSPEVSGEPVLIELFERLVLRTHWTGLVYSLLAVTLVLLLVLRSLKLGLLAAAPTAVSIVIVMGMMGFFDWTFNPANFVALPMLLGIGSVFGLHSILRMRELGNEKVLCCSTGPAILLSSATSAAGFASLLLADHRGIASLGGLVTLGLVVNALVSLFVLPSLVGHFPDLIRRSSRVAKSESDRSD